MDFVHFYSHAKSASFSCTLYSNLSTVFSPPLHRAGVFLQLTAFSMRLITNSGPFLQHFPSVSRAVFVWNEEDSVQQEMGNVKSGQNAG